LLCLRRWEARDGWMELDLGERLNLGACVYGDTMERDTMYDEERRERLS
jgi:hypothetical protein